MNPEDLLPVGEAFAELDLVVRQLDDGSLTLTTDDSLPDEARVEVTAVAEGLQASLTLAEAPELTADLARALDHLNRDAHVTRFVWDAQRVRCQAFLPFGDRTFAPNQLRVLYGAVMEAWQDHTSALEAVISGRTKWSSVCDSARLLPPSYLAGSGQSGASDRVTHRYGSVQTVPGQEVDPRAGRASRRLAQESSGGGGGLVVVLGLLLLAGLGGGAWFITRERVAGEEEIAAGTPRRTPRASPAVASPQPSPSPTDSEAPTASPSDSPRPTPSASPSAERPSTIPLRELDEAGLLRALEEEPKRAAEIVDVWLRRELDRQAGARSRILAALGGSGDYHPDVGRALLQSFRRRPPDVNEAMDCWDATRAGLRRQLLEVLTQAQGDQRRAAVTFLEARRGEDTPDRRIEEALLILGAGSAESLGRVIEARGVEWATLGTGRALLEELARQDVARLYPLFQQGGEPLRLLILELVQGVQGQEETVVRLLVGALGDAEPAVRQRAARGCVSLGDAKVAWALARALRDETHDQTRDVLSDAFSRLPAEATVSLLRRLYRKAEPEERRAAVLGLEATQTTLGVPPLIEALGDADPGVRKVAVAALANHHGTPALRPAVFEGLGALRELARGDPDRDVRRMARDLHYKISGRMPD